MTTSIDARPGPAGRALQWLVLPILFLAGCVSAPLTQAPPEVVAMPAPAASAVPAENAKVLDQAAASSVAAAASEPEPAAAAPVPVDPLRPEVRLDLEDRATRVDLWERVRRGFAMNDLESERVRESERWYASRPDYVARMTERGSRYLFHIVEELDKRGMPMELALLPFIESAYNPQAMSVARASGMWQFIPSTGQYFELKQNIFRDDRRDVLASTRAALDYLQKLHGMFGDWHLALAAYNWGEGSVQRAMARNQRDRLPTNYESLRMPLETQGYVPKLQAVKNIIARPQAFGLTLPVLQNHPYFLSVPIERDIDVSTAIKLAGMSLEEFQTLNPQMNRPVILAEGTPQILLPYDNANRFVRELPLYRGRLATWTAWVAPRTMKPSEAARSVGMDEDDLRDINRIPARMLIKAGSTLLVPRGNSLLANVAGTIADNAQMSLAPDAPPLRKVSLKAGKRDSVASVARRYRVSPAQVAEWNDVAPGASFAPGRTVVVYLQPSAARRQARAGAPRAAHLAARPPSANASRVVKAPAGPSRAATRQGPRQQAVAQRPVRIARQ